MEEVLIPLHLIDLVEHKVMVVEIIIEKLIEHLPHIKKV
jgi:hypothetical protein